MKKLFSLFLVFLLCFTAVSCTVSGRSGKTRKATLGFSGTGVFSQLHTYTVHEVRLSKEILNGGICLGKDDTFFTQEENIAEYAKCTIQGTTYRGEYQYQDSYNRSSPFIKYTYTGEGFSFSLRADTEEIVQFSRNVTYEEDMEKNTKNAEETALTQAMHISEKYIDNFDAYVRTVTETHKAYGEDGKTNTPLTFYQVRFYPADEYDAEDPAGLAADYCLSVTVTSKGTVTGIYVSKPIKCDRFRTIKVDREEIDKAFEAEIRAFCDQKSYIINDMKASTGYVAWNYDGTPYFLCRTQVWLDASTFPHDDSWIEEQGVSVSFTVEVKLK